ncbi:MAG: regulatory iron-sulfur-containing complex subunit RicT, partial [Bacilli bacterium]
TVIVETEWGLSFGVVMTDIMMKSDTQFQTPLKNIVRVASKEDYYHNKKNISDAKKALEIAKELVKKHDLSMYIINATYTFSREQLVFKFVADHRVDFRGLAKDLANIYKTRIELRQVGVRDKAREVGGIGQCGRCLCCTKVLNDFTAVSINMAKNQNIALNPSKINGICGRLMCCLKYEEDDYTKCRKCLPKVGNKIKTEKGEGVVIKNDIGRGTYSVEISNYGVMKCEIDNHECR